MSLATTTPIKVLLTSQSPIKKSAVEKFFSSLSKQIVLTCYSSDSINLPAQPINCSIPCAQRRIEALNPIINNYDLTISIENDITFDHDRTKYYDCAGVVIRSRNGIVGIGQSEKIFCPVRISYLGEIIDFSDKIKGYGTTAGSYFVFKNLTLNANNWMKDIANIDRFEQIIDGLDDAYGQLLEQINKCNEISNSSITYNSFPKPGCNFKYFYTLFYNKSNMQKLSNILTTNYCGREFDAVLPLESRGLVIGSILASGLGCAMIPFQKIGKIPGNIIEVKYKKEYGDDSVCISLDLFEKFLSEHNKKHYRFLIVDDLVATGGSMEAGLDILSKLSKMHNFSYYVELLALDEVAELRDVAAQKLKEHYSILFRSNELDL